MARKSTNSKNSEKTEKSDSQSDSDEIKASQPDGEENTDAPVVIEGEAEDITEDLSDATDSGTSDPDTDTDQTTELVTSEKADDEAEATEDAPSASDDSLPAATPAPVTEQQSSSALPLVFGGVIAGLIGFGASHFGVLEPESDAALDTTAFETQVAELNTQIGALSDAQSGLADEVAGLAPTDTAPLSARLDEIAADLEALQGEGAPASDLIARVEALETQAPVAAGDPEISEEMVARLETLESDVTATMGALSERLTSLEDRLSDFEMAQDEDPTGDMADDQLAAFQNELEQLTSDATAQVEDAKARASAFEAEAAAAAAQAERVQAVASLTSAVEGGVPFQEELSVFDDPPKALTAVAETGVPTMNDLQRAFPDMARAALSTVTVVPQDASAGDRLTAFLKRQTNARSLAPQEGDSTDAVLSRAEAAVGAGDLEASLEELSSLSEDAKDVLGPWMANAQARLDALSALSEISAAE